jgi:4-hydroxy-3-methylbut-2-enyl diphosphate reductase
VETAAEVDPQWFDDVHTVGITAGASTPRWIIEEVVEKVRTSR